MFSTTCLASKPLVKLFLILALTGTSGCATSSAVTDYCLIAGPITYSSMDTPETIDQIVKHNSDFLCACRDDCA